MEEEPDMRHIARWCIHTPYEFYFRLITKLFIYLVLIVIIYIEIISYNILPLQWVKLPKCKVPNCQKVLIVADPQIIGSDINGHDFVNFIAKWDCDRYIRKTFIKAFNYAKPDVVVFLGDIMDEGHISTDEEFFNDLDRFLNIFQMSSVLSNVHKIYLPGDNDIGGIEDVMFPHIVHRFNKIFNQSERPVPLDGIEFYKVNFMTNEIQEPTYIDTSGTDSTIRVCFSHVPVLPNPTQFLQKVVKSIRPHVIFSGHAHLSSHFIASEANIQRTSYMNILPNETEGKTYTLETGLIHEIVVPTCSYRMGVNNMGYGLAYLDTKKHVVHYSVLWLPRRFTQLSVYLILIFVSSFLFFLSVTVQVLRRVKRLFCRIYYKTITSQYYHIP